MILTDVFLGENINILSNTRVLPAMIIIIIIIFNEIIVFDGLGLVQCAHKATPRSANIIGG